METTRKRPTARPRKRAKRKETRWPETERFLRLLAGPRFRERIVDGHLKVDWDATTTVNLVGDAWGHPQDEVCLSCPANREKLAKRVWRTRTRTAYIGVLISSVDDRETVWRKRRDGHRFPDKFIRRTNRHVRQYQALWSELDDGNPKEQRRRILSFGVSPTMIVRTGGKSRHAYWVLSEPVDEGRFRATMRRLCAEIGGDVRSIDPMRQLRLPGAIHRKSLGRGRPKRARLIHAEERFASIDEIEAALTLPSEEVDAYFKRHYQRDGAKHDRFLEDDKPTSDYSDAAPSSAADHDDEDRLAEWRRIEAEVLALDDEEDDAVLEAMYQIFGPIQHGERNDMMLRLVRWCHRLGRTADDAKRLIEDYTFLHPGTSKDAADAPDRVRREIESAVNGWYSRPRQHGAAYLGIDDLEDWVFEIAENIPRDWPQADVEGLHEWFTGFIRYMMCIAHRRGFCQFRGHSLQSRGDIERLGPPKRNNGNEAKGRDRRACSQPNSREGRRMAFRSFALLTTLSEIYAVSPEVRHKKTRTYNSNLPVVSPAVWEQHCNETTRDWAARAAKRQGSENAAHGGGRTAWKVRAPVSSASGQRG